MNTLARLKDELTWQEFLIEIESNPIFVDRFLVRKIKKIIENGVENITLDFPIPTKKLISKYKSQKKRVVYSFGEPYNTYLKCINFILSTDATYPDQFCINSVAYQKGKGIKKYIESLQHQAALGRRKYYIKSDFTDFFNSIDLDILIEKMKGFFKESDNDLFEFLVGILSREEVNFRGNIIKEPKKGVMAGMPISGYLSNIYMNDVDWEMYKQHVYYTRYADDILIVTHGIDKHKSMYNELIKPLNLELNPSKTEDGLMKDGVTFLGFTIQRKRITIAEKAMKKMKKRIKRRSKWFNKWLKENNVSRETAAKTFIKGMNKKFYSRSSEDGTCWLEWYAKSVTTDEQFKEIDTYMCQYIRYILSGKQKGYKKNAEIPYEKLKKLGFKPLVNEYWKLRKSYIKKVKSK